MKQIALLLALVLLLSGCAFHEEAAQVVATTKPVYDFTTRLCAGTDITVSLLVTENVSCLHDYTLQVRQMRVVEAASLVILSGGGLEEFLSGTLENVTALCDASEGLALHHMDGHEHGDHHEHDGDPHIWLSPLCAKAMAKNICAGLEARFPRYTDIFQSNLAGLLQDLDDLQAYGEEVLSALSSRELVTFHDGFSYFCEAFHLSILQSIEEESGSEASAADLIALIQLVESHQLRAIFTEASGATAAADIVSAETGCPVYALDMGMSERSYFDAMYYNINTLQEALK